MVTPPETTPWVFLGPGGPRGCLEHPPTHPLSPPPPGITNQASIEELSPYEEEPPAPPGRHKHNGEVE